MSSTSTNIEWTDVTWNPVVGCSPVSSGCVNCYAATMAKRLGAMGQSNYVGLTVDRHVREDGTRTRAVFNGVVRCLPERLAEPLKWKKPKRIFVNSMSDLFHEDVPFEFVNKVFAVMALCPRHTFQILTKRPERMAEYLAAGQYRDVRVHDALARLCSTLDDGTIPAKLGPLDGRKFIVPRRLWAQAPAFPPGMVWPLPNVWLGTSVESQDQIKRVWALLKCPAAVRFVSAEPLLGPLDFNAIEALCKAWSERLPTIGVYLDWVIVGGESGPNARPCNIAWIRSIVKQCKGSGVPVFVKQCGARPYVWPCDCGACDSRGSRELELVSRKGGDPAEWPEDLRVREMPAGA